jgi:hypothetical protein
VIHGGRPTGLPLFLCEIASSLMLLAMTLFFVIASEAKQSRFHARVCFVAGAPPKKQHYSWSKDAGAVSRTAQQARSGIGPYEIKVVSSIDNPGQSWGLLLAMKEKRHTC